MTDQGSFLPVASMTQPAMEPTPFMVASGLEGPRGLRFGPDGYLYVAEAAREAKPVQLVNARRFSHRLDPIRAD